jgi:chromosome partitioning protein
MKGQGVMTYYHDEMKVLAIMQQKGGVGKTTICRNIAEYNARYRNSRTLLIDFDPQCNLSKRYLDMRLVEGRTVPPIHPTYDPDEYYEDGWDGTCSSVDFFRPIDILPYSTEIENLDILPGHEQLLNEVLSRQDPEFSKVRVSRMFDFFTENDVHEQYDLIVIDTPPNQLASTQAAIKAATHTIIPVKPEEMCIENISQMGGVWRNENMTRQQSDRLELIGILPNLVANTALHTGEIMAMKNDPTLGDLIIPCVVKVRTQVAEADHPMSGHQSVFDLPPKNPARTEAEAYCEFIATAMFGENPARKEAS